MSLQRLTKKEDCVNRIVVLTVASCMMSLSDLPALWSDMSFFCVTVVGVGNLKLQNVPHYGLTSCLFFMLVYSLSSVRSLRASHGMGYKRVDSTCTVVGVGNLKRFVLQ